ncbi:hypothetical protein B0A55_09078 [Friedmanniomyces simplex]|uniref:Uncharacterized protein n=1 Tax=Friedmanniomyces simplex TaxID=329884 RepID=A0A4U0X4T2_9PEZI|nr:hypothetical protein B0A55_09078 [Friedmanniomyces simplex]
MPTLKQINCSIELGSSNAKMKEYGARYSDGAVETFIAVPETKMPFYIHLQTKGYIAPGLAAFVFMDGQYQCNRNRLRLRLPEDGVDPSQYEIDFFMRQKEEKAADGRFVGREWTFTQLNTTTADKAATLNPNFLQNVGTIEVVVLRCKSEGEYVHTPQASRSKIEYPHSRKQSNASAAKQKGATPAESFAEDMFGLFDGVNDGFEVGATLQPIISFDGTNDLPDHVQKSVRPYGWTATVPGQENVSFDFQSANINHQPSEFGARGGHRDDIPSAYGVAAPPQGSTYAGPSTEVMEAEMRAEDMAKMQLAHQTGQLDGQAGNVSINQTQLPDRAANDMKGDKYLGLKGDSRAQYKAHLRSQGYSVSESAVTREQPPYFNPQPAEVNRQPAGFNRQPADFNRQPADLNNQHMAYQNAYQNPHGPTIAEGMANRQAYAQPQQAPVFNSKTEVAPYKPQSKKAHEASVPHPNVYLDPQGNVTVDNEFVAAGDVDALLAGLMKVHKNLERKIIANQVAFEAIPSGHPDKGPNRQEAEELYATSKRNEKIFNRISSAVGDAKRKAAAEAAKVNTGGGGDLTAQLRARQDAQLQGQVQATAQAEAGNGGFQQVGEGIVGGGASYDQNLQQPQSQQEQKTPKNAGDWGAPDKQNNTADNGWGVGQQDKKNGEVGNGWGGGQQGNSGGWGGEAQKGGKSDNWKGSASHRSSRSVSNKSWGNDQGNHNGGDGGWGAASNNGNDDGGGGGSGWGGQEQQATPRASASQAGGWGDGAQQATPRASAPRFSGYDPATPTPASKAKPHWLDWKQAPAEHELSDPNTKKKREEPRPVYQYPAPQLPAVPEGKTNEVSHAVQPGKGADYSHRCHRPNYMDEMAAPYAVFSFKYRSKKALEKILKRDVAADTDAVVAQAEKEKLLSMPRDRLVEELMKMKSPQLGGQMLAIKSSAEEKDESAGQGWGGGSGKAASAAGGGWNDGSNKGDNYGAHDGGWGANGGGAGGWGAQSNKGGPKKPASNGGGWGDDNKQNGGTTAWDQNANHANTNAGGRNTTPAAGGGWDGGNDSNNAKAQTPAVKHGYTPIVKDFAYAQPQPDAHKTQVDNPNQGHGQLTEPQLQVFSSDEEANYRSGAPSMATGFTRSEKDHTFDGNKEFLHGAGGGGMRGIDRGGMNRGGMNRGRRSRGGMNRGGVAFATPQHDAGAGYDLTGQMGYTPGNRGGDGYLSARGRGGRGGIARAGGDAMEAGQGYGGNAVDMPEMTSLEAAVAKRNDLLEKLKVLRALGGGGGGGGAAGAGQGPGYDGHEMSAGMPGGLVGGQVPGRMESDPMKKWEDGEVSNKVGNW